MSTREKSARKPSKARSGEKRALMNLKERKDAAGSGSGAGAGRTVEGKKQTEKHRKAVKTREEI